MADNERKFVEDKVYLRGPDGQVWEYEALLANQSGFTAFTLNPSKAAAAQAEADAKAAADEQEAIKAADEKAKADAAKAAMQPKQPQTQTVQKPK